MKDSVRDIRAWAIWAHRTGRADTGHIHPTWRLTLESGDATGGWKNWLKVRLRAMGGLLWYLSCPEYAKNSSFMP